MTEPSAPARAYRIGIDVGGTFTKAVLIDNATHEVVGRFFGADHARRSARRRKGRGGGVSATFLSSRASIPRQVIFLAHSTTQATNALLEGDVASVGVIGMATRMESLLARARAR